MLTRTSLIIVGLLAGLISVFLNAHFLISAFFQISSFSLTLPFNQRDLVLLIGVGLIGLRWFLVHRKRTDDEEM